MTASTLCFVSSRNLGDAVIHSTFLRALASANYADRYIVWTFAQAAFLFEGIERTEIVVSDFPMGATIRSFLRGGWRSFIAAALRIRRARPTHALELVADVRERWTCRLVKASQTLSPAWEAGHPFRAHIRSSPFEPSNAVTIPARVTGLYEALNLVLAALIGPDRAHMNSALPWPELNQLGERGPRIGIHPFASAPCKLWPADRWIELINALRDRYPQVRLTLFGAPADRTELESLVQPLEPHPEIFTDSLRGFERRLSDLDLLIGLDSFSVHLAHKQQVPAIVLVGANDPRIFTPPGATAVDHPGNCVHQPCGGRPKCIGTAFQFACMNSISPTQVLDAIQPH